MSTDFTGASWTALELLADVYRACRLPATGTIDYPPAVVLQMATQSLHDWAGHMLQTAHEGRLVTTILRKIGADAQDVAGQVYEMPPMSAGDTLDSLMWSDPINGNDKRLEEIPVAMLPLFTRSTASGSPSGYAFMDGTVRVFPRPSTGGTLKMVYQRRHGVLTNKTDVTGVIQSFAAHPTNSGATRVTLTTQPSWTTLAAADWVDVVGKYSPYRIKAHGLVNLKSGTLPQFDVLMPLADFAQLQPTGDTIVVYGLASVVSLPLEMREAFTRQVAARLLSEIGDLPISMAQDQLSNAAGTRVRDMLSPRAKGQPQKIYNPNSIARGGHAFRRRWPGV